MKLNSIVVFSLSTIIQANGQESAWRLLGTVNHPGHVIAVNENGSYNNNLIFAFGGTGTEVEVAFTGWEGPTITTETILAEQAGSNFGAGLATCGDFDNGGDVAIGAPIYVNGTVISGAVSVYSFDVAEGGGSGVIEQRGRSIVGGYDSRGPDDTGFGSAIAYMERDMMVICAPNDNTLLYEKPHGRCFVYWHTIVSQEPNEFDWIKHPGVGTAFNDYVGDSGDNFGSAVSGGCCVQDDDNAYSQFFVVGSPNAYGGGGNVRVVARLTEADAFESYGDRWGVFSQDACGTSVVSRGNLVAFGCPGAGANRNGLVRVFAVTNKNSFQELGTGVAGLDGDKLGDVNTIALTQYTGDPLDEDDIRQAVAVTVTTAAGVVKELYFLNNEWTEMSNPYNNKYAGTNMAAADVSYEFSYLAVSNTSGSQIIESTYTTAEPTKAPVTLAPVEMTPSPTTVAPTRSSTNPPTELPPGSSGAAGMGYSAIFGIIAGLGLSFLM